LTSLYSEQETSPAGSGKWKSAGTENVRKGRKELKADGKEKYILSSRERAGVSLGNGLERTAVELGK
jgi:hypothetical protein